MAGSGGEPTGRSVASKVTAVLDAFTPARPRLTLNQIADAAGMPLSTAYRIVAHLVRWGGLERLYGGGYGIGQRMWEVGLLYPRGATMRDVVLPFMQDLYEATHENVQLAVLDGRQALYLEKLMGRRAVSVKTRRGGRLPLHATAVGKVFLAYAEPAFVDEVIGAGLRRYTPHTVIAPGHLRRELREARRTGLAMTREELTVGIVSVASPILDDAGGAVAALSISVRSSRTDFALLAGAVRTAALCASRRLRGALFAEAAA